MTRLAVPVDKSYKTATNDCVLEICLETMEQVRPTTSVTRPNRPFLSLDDRRLQVLSKLQSTLSHQSLHYQQEQILTKDTFFQLFSNSVSFLR